MLASRRSSCPFPPDRGWLISAFWEVCIMYRNGMYSTCTAAAIQCLNEMSKPVNRTEGREFYLPFTTTTPPYLLHCHQHTQTPLTLRLSTERVYYMPPRLSYAFSQPLHTSVEGAGGGRGWSRVQCLTFCACIQSLRRHAVV